LARLPARQRAGLLPEEGLVTSERQLYAIQHPVHGRDERQIRVGHRKKMAMRYATTLVVDLAEQPPSWVALVSLTNQSGGALRLDLWRKEHVDKASEIVAELLAGVGAGEVQVARGVKAIVAMKPLASMEIAATLTAVARKDEPCRE
jgi:hypothetical protein